jgi:DNA-binding HxlR family transcriptional regulator
MSEFRYAQFCPLARAAEVVGERWTLLIVRELLVGPQRFSDLRRRLPGVSPSVLTERLERIERRGLVRRSFLPPPAASTVYELDAAGIALLPAMIELARWGIRFLLPAVEGDHFEPDWLRMALRAFATRSAAPAKTYELQIGLGDERFVATVTGGAGGAEVQDGAAPNPDARICLAPHVLLGLAAGVLTPDAVTRSGEASVEGDPDALALLPRFFELAPNRPVSSASSS